MSRPPVLTKRDMYARLDAGEFGNTIPQWFDLAGWLRDGSARYPLWGVRSTVAGGDKRSRLNVPTAEVLPLVAQFFPGQTGGFNLSPMIDQFAVLRGQAYRGDGTWAAPGLHLEFVDPRADLVGSTHPWRTGFTQHRIDAEGARAVRVLDQYLWPDDREWLDHLLDEYPGHVVEFSACDRAVGRLEGRNTIIWEVRRY